MAVDAYTGTRTAGSVHQVNISAGGVPKRSIPRAIVTPLGIEGDRHSDPRIHGGPEKAVCLFSLEVIERLRGEGHPIAPGTAGENVTLAGLDWSLVRPGARLRIGGGVELEVVAYTGPCKTIAGSFAGGECGRIAQRDHPGDSRVYARVLATGEIAPGDHVILIPAAVDG